MYTDVYRYTGCIPRCVYIRERGVTPNGLMETPWPRWMARDPWDTPSCSCCCCCCCFRGVACRHLPAGKDEQDLRRKTRGGRFPRGLSEGVSPMKRRVRARAPPSQITGNVATVSQKSSIFPGGLRPPGHPGPAPPRSTAYELMHHR